MNKKLFIKEYAKAVYEGNAAVFAGAGTSVGAGFVDWRTLVEPFANELNLDISKEKDLVRVTQYYVNSKGGRRGNISNKIIDEFSQNGKITDTLELLTRLPISTYWTTNYDQNIEKSLENQNRKADVKKQQEDLAISLRDRDAVVYKMHGDVTLPNKAIITKDDYEMYNETHSLFTTALKGDLVSKTFLFVGFSFEDPNLDDILGKIRVLLEKDNREHYCLLKKVELKDFNNSNEDFNAAKVRQKLRIEDLKRYGIETILLDSYDEIPKLLSEIERIYLNKTIFISGSIATYPEHWLEKEVNTFCYNLSKAIVSDGYKVISGFGIGIGSSVINGALDEIFLSKYKHINEHLSLYPFPQIEGGEKSLKERWTENRNVMISNSGICIFMFGNKVKNGKNVIADGMLEEFEIAKELGKIIIPIGNTAEAANEIFRIMKEEKELHSYLEDFWNILEDGKTNDVISKISEIIKQQQ